MRVCFQILRLALLLLCGLVIAGCGKTANAPTNGPIPSATNKPPNAPAANASTNPSVHAAMLHKSTFEDRPGAGRDPFFPNSPRRQQAVAQQNGEVSRPKLPPSKYLKVTALLYSSKPFAGINGTMFSPGDRGEVMIVFTNALNTLESQKVQVRCLAIHKDSVSVSVEGEPGTTKLDVP